jgi:hypothetical protein
MLGLEGDENEELEAVARSLTFDNNSYYRDHPALAISCAPKLAGTVIMPKFKVAQSKRQSTEVLSTPFFYAELVLG